MTPCSVPRGGFLYKMIVLGGGFLLPSCRVPGGMVMDETDTCIIPASMKLIGRQYALCSQYLYSTVH